MEKNENHEVTEVSLDGNSSLAYIKLVYLPSFI